MAVLLIHSIAVSIACGRPAPAGGDATRDVLIFSARADATILRTTTDTESDQ